MGVPDGRQRSRAELGLSGRGPVFDSLRQDGKPVTVLSAPGGGGVIVRDKQGRVVFEKP